MKVSVIMPSYLGDYANAASNREMKLGRAVSMFLGMNLPQTELIVVADGCEKTIEWINKRQEVFKNYQCKVELVYISKQTIFSGKVRQAGLSAAKGELIVYCDSDDMIFGTHLQDIVHEFEKNTKLQWVYFNDYVCTSFTNSQQFEKRQRENIIQLGRIGTSGIAHKRNLDIEWMDGYGHDWRLIEQLNQSYPHFTKIKATGYLVCHIPGQVDL